MACSKKHNLHSSRNEEGAPSVHHTHGVIVASLNLMWFFLDSYQVLVWCPSSDGLERRSVLKSQPTLQVLSTQQIPSSVWHPITANNHPSASSSSATTTASSTRKWHSAKTTNSPAGSRWPRPRWGHGKVMAKRQSRDDFPFLCNIVISAIIFIGGKFVHEQGRDCVICLISAVVMITTITDIKQLLWLRPFTDYVQSQRAMPRPLFHEQLCTKDKTHARRWHEF